MAQSGHTRAGYDAEAHAVGMNVGTCKTASEIFLPNQKVKTNTRFWRVYHASVMIVERTSMLLTSMPTYSSGMAYRGCLAKAEAHLREACRLLRLAQINPNLLDELQSLQIERESRFAYSIRDVQKMVGLGRTTIYKAIKEGRLKSVKEGTRTLILRDELLRWIAGFRSSSGQAGG